MARRSARPGRSDFRFADGEAGPPPVTLAGRTTTGEQPGVSISLRYYRQETECFSEWKDRDLRKFSATIQKLKNMTADALKRHTRLCERHKHAPASDRFTRPDDLSRDLPMFEIRVDGGNLARIHGVFEGSVFHLVWLDCKHRVFPQ